MLNLYQATVIITAFFFTGFAGFAIWKNKNDIQAQRFAVLALAFAVWSYSWFGMLKTTSDYHVALFFARLLNLGATFIPVLFLHWIFSVLNIEKIKKNLLKVCYFITVVFALLSFTNLYVTGVRNIGGFPYWPIAGPLYIYFVLIGYVGFISTGLIFLVKNFLKSKNELRYRIVYIFLGSFLGFVGGAVNFPIMFGYEVPQPYDLIGIFMLMASPFVFSYAAVHYKLFGIKNVAVQLFAGALNIVFVINILLATDFYDIFINSLLLGFTLWFTFLLLKTLRREVEQREKIELLAADLEKANTRLRELDRQKSEFVSFANHQLRAPLTAMKGYSSLLLEGEMGELTPEARKGVSRIYDSTNTLVSIVNDYLNVTRIELGSMNYNFEQIDFKALVQDVIAELRPTIDRTGLSFSFDVDHNQDYMIKADRDKLKQVVVNLVDNSLKYTPSGWVKINLNKDKATNKIIFKVSDSGVGIAPEVLPKLFQKFKRADNANKVNIRGTGLGLYVAKEMLEAHHGSIRAESAGEGKGSTFIVEL